jgi:hypothetical protein
MKRFSLGQKWVMTDPVYGAFFGEVIEISDDGNWGVVIITGDRDNIVDELIGSAADFQASGEWQLIEE